ncbi:STAS/SEC14 domain-containing protein [Pontibacter liquoris]|uniref:STAS/SEC14 domain-containing protein n=1 Tax=Pontibacter liquoris TaxID=2905677 RepID=UPI001FA7CDE4|nr:STAS/SEC14 domain-containing protein [Pontibacter liquoris]
MTQELTNPFGRVYLTIKQDSRNRWIYVNWMGYLTAENIKEGAAAYTETLQKAGYSCVLNDTRLIIGSWNHSLDWVLNEWAPNAAKAGLKHFAMITNPDSLGASSAENFYSNITAFQTEMFDNIEDARLWLRRYSQQG